MSTAFLTHPDCLHHVTPQGHPERVARLEAILQRMDAPEFGDLVRHEAPLADLDKIAAVHPMAYIERIRDAVPASGHVALDGDTYLSPGSYKAALRGAGANIKAVDLVMSGEVDNAFCAVRPPGHHAETETSMGFCLFGNVVIGAVHALDAHGLDRVAIVDFDVHHGNGTQDLVWNDGRITFASTHEMPLYPGSGHAHETGAHGQVINVPLKAYTDGAVFRQKMEALVLPAIAAQRPQMLFISAGFDAHMMDPLANLNLTEDDFAWVTRKLCDLADTHCDGRVVSTLEGGYDLPALADATAAHVRGLMERGR